MEVTYLNHMGTDLTGVGGPFASKISRHLIYCNFIPQ